MKNISRKKTRKFVIFPLLWPHFKCITFESLLCSLGIICIGESEGRLCGCGHTISMQASNFTPQLFRRPKLCARLKILAKQTLALAGGAPKNKFCIHFPSLCWRRLIFFNRARNEWAKHELWHWVMSLCTGEQTNNEISPALPFAAASAATRKAPSSLDIYLCNYSSKSFQIKKADCVQSAALLFDLSEQRRRLSKHCAEYSSRMQKEEKKEELPQKWIYEHESREIDYNFWIQCAV